MSDNPVELAEEAAIFKLIGEALIERGKALAERAGAAMGRGTLYPRLPDGSELGTFVMPGPSNVVRVDPDLLVGFVRVGYPEQIVESVRPAFVEVLKRLSRQNGRPTAPHGEVDFPGIEVVTEPAKGPRITPTDLACERAARAVESVLAGVLEQFTNPILPEGGTR